MRKKFFNLFSISLFVAATFSGSVNANLKEDLNKKNNAESAVFDKCYEVWKQGQYNGSGGYSTTGGIRYLITQDDAVWRIDATNLPTLKKCGYARVGTLNKNYTFDICDRKFKPLYEATCKGFRKKFKSTKLTNYFEIDGEKLTRYFQYKGDETETGSYRKVK